MKQVNTEKTTFSASLKAEAEVTKKPDGFLGNAHIDAEAGKQTDHIIESDNDCVKEDE